MVRCVSLFFDCSHNTAQLHKVINYMFLHEEKESTNAVEELSKEKTEATQTIELKRSTSEVLVTVRFNEAGLDTRWRSQPLVNKAQEHTVIDADREALRKVLKEEIPKTHRQGSVFGGKNLVLKKVKVG